MARPKWCIGAGKGQSFLDVACNPGNGAVLIVGKVTDSKGEEKCQLWYLPDAKTGFVGVWLRHLPDATIRAPEFLSDGSLLFSAEGDLWHGIPGVDREPPRPPRADITAYRYAPVAERSTYSGSPAQFGVRDIAYGAGHIYVQLGRINGGEALKVLKLAPPAFPENHAYTEHNGIEDSIRILKSAKEVGGQRGFSCLCASPDRTKVYMKDGGTRFLAEAGYEDGEPVAFRIGNKILIKE
ncbi:MAG: hypothetical protein QM755_00475 [Luteolibacter sp.]